MYSLILSCYLNSVLLLQLNKGLSGTDEGFTLSENSNHILFTEWVSGTESLNCNQTKIEAMSFGNMRNEYIILNITF